MTAWHVTVEYPTADVAQAGQTLGAALVAAGAVTAVHHDDRSRVAISTIVEDVSTMRQAIIAGQRAAARIASAVDGLGEPVRIEALTDEEVVRDLRRPPLPELVGATEAGEILGVSKSRISQLPRDHADFPAPVADLASGKVYTRASIEAFGERWERRRTGRPRKSNPA